VPDCAAIVLTGGASRRMGRDKASIRPPGWDRTFAQRTAGLVAAVAGPAVEVGPGRTFLAALSEDPPGAGPLAAVAAGWGALAAGGWRGPVLVVATDLPFLDLATLSWLAGHPTGASLVPICGGRPQPLCARYGAADLDTARRLARAGSAAMAALLAATEPLLVEAPRPEALRDVDTPADLALAGLAGPQPGGPPATPEQPAGRRASKAGA
jgi:molybdopterin-guanine dinucleotide biosynthesis protein A